MAESIDWPDKLIKRGWRPMGRSSWMDPWTRISGSITQAIKIEQALASRTKFRIQCACGKNIYTNRLEYNQCNPCRVKLHYQNKGKSRNEELARIGFKIPAHAHAALMAIAKQENNTLNGLVEAILIDWLQTHHPDRLTKGTGHG